ncbi:glycoside hydrolase [uncultured Aquimarina sp.]|uniref:glycoside hydrolase family 16 protein n=1 Tax=uncultured Aquimarina sp. TaxID=575652 RepID=UPI002628AAAB|nr:glycoside hydrolase [uncultured Aquimarina sp.]
MRMLVKSFGALLLIYFTSACETEDVIIEESSNDIESIDEISEKAGPWNRQFTDNFNSGGNLNQWQKTSRNDYNSNLCKYESWIPRIRTLDGRSSLELRAFKSGSQYKSGHVKSWFDFHPGRNEEYRLRSRIKLIAKDGNNYKGFSETYGAWPAFWTVNENNWPTRGESDIMEGYSFGNSARFASNLFYGVNFLQNQLGTSAERRYNNNEGWHTYEQRWINRNGWVTVQIYVDGNRVANYNNNVNGNLKLQNFKDHHIIFNLNVGSNTGIFNNSNINLFSNTYMYVDYVRLDKRSI